MTSRSTAVGMSHSPINAGAGGDVSDGSWRAAGLTLLSVRFIQGFIYWGGGSRRLIYAPSKLDPHMPVWMANKFQSAMPGALFGLDHVIAFMLRHFWLLYPSIIIFSAAELVAGLLLMSGLFTRAAALVSVGFSILLMLMFGWQGATCIDEWTMAAANLAMGATLVLAGGSAFSIDNVLLRRRPVLAERGWFRWACGALPLPLSPRRFQTVAIAVLAATALFNVGTYDHFRGAVYGPFHKGPVSPSTHHFSVSEARLFGDGAVRFKVYLDGGTADVPAHIVELQLRAAGGAVLSRWDSSALSSLPGKAIENEFPYNKVVPGRYGLNAEMGAMATISLPSQGPTPDRPATLVLITVSGHEFKAPLSPG